MLRLAIALIMALLITGCVPNNNKNINDAQNLRRQQEMRDSSEKLALNVEYQMSSTTFMNLENSLNQSLANDPQNLRAKFYTSMLAPLLAYRGYVAKIQHLFANEQYNAEMEKIVSDLSQELKTFLLYGYGKFGSRQDIIDFNGYVATLRNNFEKVASDKYPEHFRLNVSRPGSAGVYVLKPQVFQSCNLEIKSKTTQRTGDKQASTDMDHISHALETFKELLGIFGCSQRSVESLLVNKSVK